MLQAYSQDVIFKSYWELEMGGRSPSPKAVLDDQGRAIDLATGSPELKLDATGET